MPTPQSVDYDSAKLLYVKGMTLRDIADKVGIPLVNLRAMAVRQKWSQAKTSTANAIERSVSEQLQTLATQHLLKMSGLAERAIETLSKRDFEKLKLSELEILARCADSFDRIARRTYSLDREQGSTKLGLAVNVSVQGERSSVASRIIEIESSRSPETLGDNAQSE